MNRVFHLLVFFLFVAWTLSIGVAKETADDAAKWEKKYKELLKKRPDIRKKVESGNATKEQVIEWMKKGGDRQYKKGKKYYGSKIEVKDPAEFQKKGEKTIYSGPQLGEKLLPFKATVLRGKRKGDKYDPIAAADGKPLVLIFQDDSVVGQKGLLLCGGALETIAKKSRHGLHVSTTFLVDDPSGKILKYDFMDEIANIIQMSVSTDRRDGPGAYGLNRNVAMTILVAKDGKVLHNFVFEQPMLYPDPYVMGAIADAVGVDRPTLASWFKKDSREKYENKKPPKKKPLPKTK